MKINFGIIVLLLMHLKSATSDLERELRISIDKAMHCDRREPPTDPVIAMSPKRFAQLVGLLRHDLNPPVCDKGRHYPPFRLEDPQTWTFCVFGSCKNNKCHCFKNYAGPSCAVHTSNCWLMYCYLTSCHSSLQSFNCKCDTKLYGTRVKTQEYWYDTGKQHTYVPPPPGWKDDVAQGSQSANAPSVKEIFVPLSKPKPGGGGGGGGANQRQQLNPNSGSVQIFEGGWHMSPFQSQQHQPLGGQAQGFNRNGPGSFSGSSGNQRIPGSSLQGARKNSRPGSHGSGGNRQEDNTDDIEEALEEMTEEPSSSMSLFGKEYVSCSVALILNYGYQYIWNI